MTSTYILYLTQCITYIYNEIKYQKSYTCPTQKDASIHANQISMLTNSVILTML